MERPIRWARRLAPFGAERAHLEAEAAKLAYDARDRFIARAKEDLPSLLDGPLAEFVRTRAEELMQDHARLRAAAGSALPLVARMT